MVPWYFYCAFHTVFMVVVCYSFNLWHFFVSLICFTEGWRWSFMCEAAVQTTSVTAYMYIATVCTFFYDPKHVNIQVYCLRGGDTDSSICKTIPMLGTVCYCCTAEPIRCGLILPPGGAERQQICTGHTTPFFQWGPFAQIYIYSHCNHCQLPPSLPGKAVL